MASYSLFCHVRRTRCSQYKRSPRARPGGWNHVSCCVCDKLKRLISTTSGKLEKEEEHKRYRAELKEHHDFQNKHRQHYYKTRAKAIRNHAHDVSMIVDAAGGAGTTYQPRYHSTEKNEPARHFMCKVKHTFVKMHGIGTLVVQSLPDLESQGANLTIDCILRGVREVIRYRKGKSIRNLYVQMDNVSSNKCTAIITGMAALVLLGIVRKIKLSYLIVGHTHEDIDAFIGNVVSYLRRLDIRTYEELEKACKDAVQLVGSKVLNVERAIGITDYRQMFANVDKIADLSKARTIRITAKSDGTGVNVYYKDDSTKPGWFPRPTAARHCYSWSQVFKHPTNPNATAQEVVNHGPLCENGRRQEWYYNVRFSDVSEHGFTYPCPSLPCALTRACVDESLARATMQPISGNLMNIDKRGMLVDNISCLLSARGDDHAIKEWHDFIFGLPLPIYLQPASANVLEDIVNCCKNADVQLPAKYIPLGPVDASSASAFVDPIVFRGGPVTKGERDRIHREAGFSPKKRKQTKTKKQMGHKTTRATKKRKQRNCSGEESSAGEGGSVSESETHSVDDAHTGEYDFFFSRTNL